MLEYILAKEHKDRLKIISDVYNDSTRKELRICDEDEDFLDEGMISQHYCSLDRPKESCEL